jgi:hypothetical protein
VASNDKPLFLDSHNVSGPLEGGKLPLLRGQDIGGLLREPWFDLGESAGIGQLAGNTQHSSPELPHHIGRPIRIGSSE